MKLKRVTRGGEFNRLYAECKDRKVKEQKKYLMKGLRRLFPNDKATEHYVDGKLMDKYRALVERRKRFMRKAYLNNFDYFATFTYADVKHTEESFKKRLMKTLQNYATRSEWKYMGVWERGGENNRLHFHALLKVPENTMPGELIEVTDFNMKTHRQKKTIQNTFFTIRAHLEYNCVSVIRLMAWQSLWKRNMTLSLLSLVSHRLKCLMPFRQMEMVLMMYSESLINRSSNSKQIFSIVGGNAFIVGIFQTLTKDGMGLKEEPQ